MTNPWGLTPSEARVMDAVILCGSDKLAAAKLGRSQRTVEAHLYNSRRKMKRRFRLHAILDFDRWRHNERQA